MESPQGQPWGWGAFLIAARPLQSNSLSTILISPSFRGYPADLGLSHLPIRHWSVSQELRWGPMAPSLLMLLALTQKHR